MTELIRHNEVLNRLHLAAQFGKKESTHHHHKMGALVYSNYRKVLGANHLKTHPDSRNPYKCMHAEFSALRKALYEGIDIRKADLYVARTLKKGSLGLAKPCKFCWRLLSDFKVRRVFWSITNDQFGFVSLG